MAVTVTTDLVVRHAMDSTTSTTADGTGIGATGQTSTTFKVQGSASVIGQYKTAGVVGWMAGDFTAANISKLHIYGWINNLDNVDTAANGGWRMRIAATNSVMGTAYGEWRVSGQDTISRPIGGFARFCVDPNRPFDYSAGTPVALASVGAIAISNLGITSSGQNTWFMDSVDTATGITVGGGGVGTEGTSAQIATDDRTNGRGIFKNVIGAFYILGRVTIGSSSAASEFADTNQVWIFEDMPVSATFHRLVFLGASSFTNNAKFGTKTGTGTATEGAGGNTFKATGLAPFSITATDANINVGFYGCNFTNPIALRDDALRAFVVEDNSPSSFTNDTRDANSATANDAAFFPATPAVNDAPYFGHEEPFSQLKINVGTAGVGTYTVTWQYYNGSTWTSLTSLTDGTNNFKTTGTNTVTYAIPNDWATATIGGLGPYYYIRALRDGGTNTTSPLGTQMFVVMGGMVRLEASTVEAIRCTFTNMDTIRVRNGALLKKCTITNSVAPAKSAALDLGASDPAADTVRDLIVQNCIRGILLQPTGTATYNFRRIEFSGNTTDVRVDAPSAATVTINVLEGGTIPTTENVNGCTIVVQATVDVTITVKNVNTGAVVSGAYVLVTASDNTGPMPFDETVTISRSGSTATVSHTAHGLTNGKKVMIKGANQIEYNGIHTITYISANSYSYTVSGSPATPATGTIKATGVVISGTTNGSGIITDSHTFATAQPITGRVRKATGSPYYKTGYISGTISSSNGFSTVVPFVPDE